MIPVVGDHLSAKRLASSVEGGPLGPSPQGGPRPSESVTEDEETSTSVPSSSVSSTACSSSSSSSSSSPRLGTENPFLASIGDSHAAAAPICLLSDTPVVSPRASAAEIRREEERSERKVNITRQRLLQTGQGTMGAPSGGPQRGTADEPGRITTPTNSIGDANYGGETLHAPTYCEPCCCCCCCCYYCCCCCLETD